MLAISRNYGRFWRFILRDYPVKPLQGAIAGILTAAGVDLATVRGWPRQSLTAVPMTKTIAV